VRLIGRFELNGDSPERTRIQAYASRHALATAGFAVAKHADLVDEMVELA
jgi:hypothetical protein